MSQGISANTWLLIFDEHLLSDHGLEFAPGDYWRSKYEILHAAGTLEATIKREWLLKEMAGE